MDRKRIQCLSNPSQHVHTYLQPFTSYSEILVGNRNFFLPPLHLTPPYGVAPGTIAVSVTRLERGFNACKTLRCIYPSIFNRFPVIQAWSLKIRSFFAYFGLPCVRPWDNRGKCHTVGKRIQCNTFTAIVRGAYTGEAKMCKNVLKWRIFKLPAWITGKLLKIDGYIQGICAFHSNYGRICSHFGDIQRQRMAWPWNLGMGSFKVIKKGAVR